MRGEAKLAKDVGVINVFDKPYEAWTWRNTSLEEALDLVKNKGFHFSQATSVKDKLEEKVSDHFEAARRMLRVGADSGLERHIDSALDENAEYQALRARMPVTEPEELTSYQGSFTEADWGAADVAINEVGMQMAEGQFLFHGGLWDGDNPSTTTTRPFSTSFCPQIALRNAEWRGKAYDAGRVDLMVVRVTQPATKAYAYSLEGEHGNEKEIVFASGAKLRRLAESHVTDMKVYKATSGSSIEHKVVPAYVVEVELS